MVHGFLCPCRCHRGGAPTTLRVLFAHLRRMEDRGRERESERDEACDGLERKSRGSWALNREVPSGIVWKLRQDEAGHLA